MEPYAIPISELADFQFCPKSVFYHHIYAKYEASLYHERAQTEGKIVHESVDQKRYSTKKRWIQSLGVHCRKYGLYGKIDLYDTQTATLVERKACVKRVYRGNEYQLYGQYFALREMGYPVKRIQIRSVRDNKVHEVGRPNAFDEERFAAYLRKLRNFQMGDYFDQNPKKCRGCAYRELCDTGIETVGLGTGSIETVLVQPPDRKTDSKP